MVLFNPPREYPGLPSHEIVAQEGRTKYLKPKKPLSEKDKDLLKLTTFYGLSDARKESVPKHELMRRAAEESRNEDPYYADQHKNK